MVIMTSKSNKSARGYKGVKENKFTNIDKVIRVHPDITSSPAPPRSRRRRTIGSYSRMLNTVRTNGTKLYQSSFDEFI